MKLAVLCAVLCMGVVTLARPEGETSPVANPAPAEGEAAAEPKQAEVSPSEEEAARRKRWYYYYPNSPYSFGYGYPWGFDHFSRSSGPTGRTRGTPFTATFDELMNHQRGHDFHFYNQQQQWMNNQRFNPNFNRNMPDVIDTASHDTIEAESRTRGFAGNFNPNFNPNYNPNFDPYYNPNFFSNPNFYP